MNVPLMKSYSSSLVACLGFMWFGLKTKVGEMFFTRLQLYFIVSLKHLTARIPHCEFYQHFTVPALLGMHLRGPQYITLCVFFCTAIHIINHRRWFQGASGGAFLRRTTGRCLFCTNVTSPILIFLFGVSTNIALPFGCDVISRRVDSCLGYRQTRYVILICGKWLLCIRINTCSLYSFSIRSSVKLLGKVNLSFFVFSDQSEVTLIISWLTHCINKGICLEGRLNICLSSDCLLKFCWERRNLHAAVGQPLVLSIWHAHTWGKTGWAGVLREKCWFALGSQCECERFIMSSFSTRLVLFLYLWEKFAPTL